MADLVSTAQYPKEFHHFFSIPFLGAGPVDPALIWYNDTGKTVVIDKATMVTEVVGDGSVVLSLEVATAAAATTGTAICTFTCDTAVGAFPGTISLTANEIPDGSYLMLDTTAGTITNYRGNLQLHLRTQQA